MPNNLEPNLINYPEAFQKSQELLLLLKSVHFPLNLEQICEELGITLSTKEEYLNYRNCTQQPLPEIPIQDGRSYLTYNKKGEKKYLIIYDEKPYFRWRFTIAHELGHIVLGHLNDHRLQINRGGIDSSLYCELEHQADVFASNFLCPPILIHEKLSTYSFPYTVSTISNTFQISNQATVYHRLPDYEQWLTLTPSNVEEQVLEKFRTDMHYHRCNNCKQPSKIINAQYCTICGTHNKFYRIIGGQEMIYSRIDMDENNKPKECPICGNEQYVKDGDYCQICGTSIYNNCVGAIDDQFGNTTCLDGLHLSGEARFCPYCGCETTYLRYKILKPYTEEKNKHQDTPYPF